MLHQVTTIFKPHLYFKQQLQIKMKLIEVIEAPVT